MPNSIWPDAGCFSETGSGEDEATASVSACLISTGDACALSKATAASVSEVITDKRTPPAAVKLGYMPPPSSALIQHLMPCASRFDAANCAVSWLMKV